MTDAIITLTTDFGDASPYVAAMKGVVLRINPTARLIDLGHRLPPQDVRHASWFLAASLPYFPVGAIHVAVIDPGVGSDRAILHVEVNGCQVLAPDNGCLTGFLDAVEGVPIVRRLSERRYWRETVSDTFHGRDVFAPVAAHLSLGLDADKLGPRVTEWVRLPSPRCENVSDGVCGEIAFIDDFGNLITSIPTARLPSGPLECDISDRSYGTLPRVRTYADAAPGELVLLASSTHHLELAVVQGNAALRLGARVGMIVRVRPSVQ